MRVWRRAHGDTKCGKCPADIRPGEPMLVITVPGVSKPKQRCQRCAGEPAPELPPLEAARPIVARVKPSAARRAPLFASVGELARDWKHAQANEREPGEEG